MTCSSIFVQINVTQILQTSGKSSLIGAGQEPIIEDLQKSSIARKHLDFLSNILLLFQVVVSFSVFTLVHLFEK